MVAFAIITLLAFCAVFALRACGLLQRAELLVYDQLVRLRSNRNARNDQIVICGMTEDDLVKYGHPLDDGKLARLLANLAAANPSIVGLDLYRDLKEPRGGENYSQLADALTRLTRVIAIERIPTIKPPPALAEKPDRVAPNNVPRDYTVDGLHRRAYLFLEDNLPEARESFALVLAREYLAGKNVEAKLVEASLGAPLLKLGNVTFPRLTSDAGGYVGLPVRDYEILIDFQGSQQFRTVTFDDVLEGRIPAGALEGAIVLVSTLMESVKDANPSPINPALRGVIQHAMIVDQILRAGLRGQAPTTWWPEAGELAWIALGTVVGGVFGLNLRSPWKLAPTLTFWLLAISFAGWEAFRHGVWIPVAAPVLGALIAAALVTSFVVFLERSDRRVLQGLFSRHLSPSVAETLWAARDQFLDGGRLKPQRLIATVLFTDLKGFSTTAEQLDAGTLFDWMNEYMNGVARHVDLRGGMVNKYIGDAIMAVFGAPIAHTREEDIDNDACKAVECALAMRQELADLNAGWRMRGMPTTAMRIGIYTGALVAGSMGSRERLEFTVLGDTVNTAARLESAGKETDLATAECLILIGDSTCQRLQDRFVTQRLGEMSLKGKSQQITVHTVIAENPNRPLR